MVEEGTGCLDSEMRGLLYFVGNFCCLVSSARDERLLVLWDMKCMYGKFLFRSERQKDCYVDRVSQTDH